MKITIDTANGGEIVEIDVAEIDDARLHSLARFGSDEAREEIKKRTGLDPYKPIEEHTKEDVEFYMEWLKNNNSEEYDKIVSVDKDVK
jgi:hypothetical protein